MLEKEVERHLVQELAKNGGVCLKFVSPGNIGVPDRLCILPGNRIFFVELKTPTGVVSKVQQQQIARLNKLGVRVYVCKTPAETINVVNAEVKVGVTVSIPKQEIAKFRQDMIDNGCEPIIISSKDGPSKQEMIDAGLDFLLDVVHNGD